MTAGMARNEVWYPYVGEVLDASIKPYVLVRNIVNIRKHITRIRKTVVIHGNKE